MCGDYNDLRSDIDDHLRNNSKDVDFCASLKELVENLRTAFENQNLSEVETLLNNFREVHKDKLNQVELRNTRNNMKLSVGMVFEIIKSTRTFRILNTLAQLLMG